MGALVLGLHSVSTATVPLLAGWWVGQTIELGVAGALIGAARGGMRPGSVWSLVAIVTLACLVATIVLQSTGWAPAPQVRR